MQTVSKDDEMTVHPDNKSRRLLENIFSLYALQGLTYVLPVLVLPYLVRTLGMEVYGLTAFAQSFAQYFNVLTDYGFSFSATRTIAQNRADKDQTSRIFCSVLVVKLLLFSLGALILVLLMVLIPRFHREAAFFVVAFMAVLGNVLFPIWYFQGIEEMRYIAVATGITRVISSASLFVFVHKPADGLLALAIQAAGTFAAGVVGFIIALRKYKIHLRSPAFAELRTICIDGWDLFVSNAAISLYERRSKNRPRSAA